MNRRTVLIVLAVVIAGGIAGYNYLYKDHRNIATEEAILTVNSEELVNFFTINNGISVLNKTIEVNGTVTEVDLNANTLTLDDKVHCNFINLPDFIIVGKEVSVKGRCIGYDDIFEIVKLDQCSILK